MGGIGLRHSGSGRALPHHFVSRNHGGRRIQSVPGGTHWGGGLSIGSHDQARVGQLLLADGRVNGKRVVSAQWIQRMRTPCSIAPFYGYLTWLNHERRVFPSVPASNYFAFGAGDRLIGERTRLTTCRRPSGESRSWSQQRLLPIHAAKCLRKSPCPRPSFRREAKR